MCTICYLGTIYTLTTEHVLGSRLLVAQFVLIPHTSNKSQSVTNTIRHTPTAKGYDTELAELIGSSLHFCIMLQNI
jgi:hypothetical protein